MKCTQIWSETIPKPNDPNTTLTNQVRATAFNNDGTCCISVVGDAILVYDSDSGKLMSKPIRGAHKDTINCVNFSKDGKRFATGGNDKAVIIFKYAEQEDPRVSAELRYQHQDEVYCIAFNPLTGQIFSGGATDYALWTPDQQNIEKQKFKQKIICAAWAADGMTLAFGTMQGNIVFKTRKLEPKTEVSKNCPVWCMEWTPITQDNMESLLCVGTWNQQISFYNAQGEQVGSHKQLTFDPLSLNFFNTGEFYIVSGTNKKASLYAREGGFLIDVCEKEDWVWGAKLRSKDLFASVATNDGQICQYKIQPLTVHSLYQDKYASRDGLTDILVLSIAINSKIRVKCKELVKNVSIYKEKMAALLNERILIYISSQEDGNLKYRLQKRINKKVQCQHFEMLSHNILIAQKKKVQLLKLNGELEREWIMDAKIKFLKNIGGPNKGENILIGLQNGYVCKIIINNSFPIILQKHAIPVTVCDISMDKKNLAVVDKNNNLTVYDTITQEVIMNEMHVTSCAFNTMFNETIAYSGNGIIHIKSGNQPPLSQRYQGDVVGFEGNKMFVLDTSTNSLNTIDISQTTSMLKYIEKKEFDKAYKVACLGATNSDFQILGKEALSNLEFTIAKKCFLRINDLELYELVKKHEWQKESGGQFNQLSLQAECLAYEKQFHQAEQILLKGDQFEQAIQMWTELRRYDEAKRLLGSRTGVRPGTKRGVEDLSAENQQKIQNLLKGEANHYYQMGQWETAAQKFIECKSFKRAIEIYTQKNSMDGLMKVCKEMDKDSNKEELQQCAYQFRKNKQFQYAKQVYLQLGDRKSQVALYVEMEKFEDALAQCKQEPALLDMVKLPYAHWLSRNDQYQKALQAFKQLNRIDLTSKMLNSLSQNSVVENRFDDAAKYFWTLATECLKNVQNYEHPSNEDLEYIQKFQNFSDDADIYYAYYKIYKFIEEPIQPLSGIALLLHIFNACRYAINKLQNKSLYGVKQSYIYYALGKVAKQLEGFKTARQCYEKLQFYKINADWTEEVDLSSLLIRSKPFSDKESLLPICNRCMNTNPVISNGMNCTNCMHQMQHSFISFEDLPLVEFKVDPKISHQRVVQLLYSDKSNLPKYQKKKQQDDGWTESTTNTNVKQQAEEGTPFVDKLNEVFEMQQTSQEYIPIVLDEQILASLTPDEVYWVNYKQYCPSMEIRYFKCMVPDISIKNCPDCARFFFLDEFEFEYLKNKRCPFCKTLDQREGPQKDVFEP